MPFKTKSLPTRPGSIYSRRLSKQDSIINARALPLNLVVEIRLRNTVDLGAPACTRAEWNGNAAGRLILQLHEARVVKLKVTFEYMPRPCGISCAGRALVVIALSSLYGMTGVGDLGYTSNEVCSY